MFPDRRVFELRSVVLAVAAATYGLVFILRWLTGDPVDALDLLYVVPIALIALELGLLAGVCSALVGSALVMASWLGVHGGVDPVAVATHTVVFVAVGVIAGRFSDRMRDAQRRQRRLLASGLALAHLVDVGLPVDQPAGVVDPHDVRFVFDVELVVQVAHQRFQEVLHSE